MNRHATTFFFVLLFTIFAPAQNGSVTTFTIEPCIGENAVSVTQTYTLTEEGIRELEILTVSLSYADLRIFDDKGDLDFEVGENIIIGRNIYRTITVFFREPTQGYYNFTVTYWFPTFATGKPITGKYIFRIVNVTDSTIFNVTIPLTGITSTSRASPDPVVKEGSDSTTFSYEFTEDATIILTYEPKEGIDYTDTETETFSYQEYTFEVTYPRMAEIFKEDIQAFIDSVFPFYLEETGVPLRFDRIEIALDKEEDTWAAAEYRGNGRIRVLINNTASYPSQFLAHELTHSYIGDFPRYLEEGVANYFEGKTARHYAPPTPENYIRNKELFFQTYERQFGERVDVTQARYGLGLTDHQEALIYAKYSKGTHIIYEIAGLCGHETVQEMLKILKEERDCDVNFLLYQLSEGDTVYQVLKKYGFDVVPPYAYPAEELLQEVQEQSWWGYTLCSLFRFENKIKTATPEEIGQIKEDIERTGEIASQTVLLADGVVVVLVFVCGFFGFKKIRQVKKENPGVVYYGYFIPVAIALTAFSYILYEFLFNGYKFRWLLKNVLTPWGLGIICGVILIVALQRLVPSEGKKKFSLDVVWSLSFFVLLVGVFHFLMLQGLMLIFGYVISLVALFVIRRRGWPH